MANKHTSEKENRAQKKTEEPRVDVQSKETINGSNEPSEVTSDETAKLTSELEEVKEKYVRLVAEFENYKKRTTKERFESIQTAGKEVISSLLEVLDDADRAEQQMDKTDDITVLKEGVQLVFHKLRNSLQAKGLKAMQSIGEDFDPDKHEAITEIPAPTEELKGKIVAEVEKGYLLNDKIIRFAKVVVGK